MFLGLKCSKCCPKRCDWTTIEFPCPITMIHIDENRCEDDVFNLFIENPATGERRFIRELNLESTPKGCCGTSLDGKQICPQTRVDVTASIRTEDLDEQCRFTVVATFVRPNCCGTFTRLRIVGPSGVELMGSYFSSYGYRQTFSAIAACEPAPPP
jgi:hypothetical protein